MSLMRPSPNRLASSMPRARTCGRTSVARRKPKPSTALTAAMTSSTVPRWTFAPRVTPAAAASASASSAGTTIVEYLSLLPERAALTSSMGIDVRVDQKLTTGTNGIDSLPTAWRRCGGRRGRPARRRSRSAHGSRRRRRGRADAGRRESRCHRGVRAADRCGDCERASWCRGRRDRRPARREDEGDHRKDDQPSCGPTE